MVLQVKCIEKIRDKNNHIIGYKIIGDDKKPIPVKSEKLKEVIRSGQLEIVNLTLTSDNRLIDKRPDTPSKSTTTPLSNLSKQNINIESLLNRLKSLGYILDTFNTDCRHKCYMASSTDNTKHILIIPDDVKYIYDKNVDDNSVGNFVFGTAIHNRMCGLGGTLKVIGGKNLISTRYMFFRCKAHSIDLKSFDTSNITNMRYMFVGCKAQSLDLSSFDTSKVTDMYSMFSGCKAQSIDLSSFNTSKVKDMNGMFMGCKVKSLDLSSFNTSKVTDMSFMFYECKAQSIDLRSFNTSKVTNMHCMFDKCEAHSLDLSSFNTSNVVNMNEMFRNCKAQSLNLSSFNTSNVTDMCSMFYCCEADIKVNNSKLKDQLQFDRR